MSNPNDLASFRAALLEGDRRLVRRRRTRAAGGRRWPSSLAIVVVATSLPSSLDATALAAEAREALAQPGLILHSETEVVLPGRPGPAADQPLVAGGSQPHDLGRRRPDRRAGGGRRRRPRPAGARRAGSTRSRARAPDPLLEYRKVLDQATDAEEVTLDGVEAYRLEMPHQVAYLRRSDRLPLRVELEGGVTLRYPVVEYVREAQLDLR